MSNETTSQDILNEVAKIWNIRDISAYRVVFVHYKYGEKLLDNYECLLTVIGNYEAHGISKIFGK